MNSKKLVDGDIIKRFIEMLTQSQAGFSEEMVLTIERQLRHEYAGERVYIPKHDKSVCALIVERFDGRNSAKLARELRVSRRTVYRSISKFRKSHNKA